MVQFGNLDEQKIKKLLTDWILIILTVIIKQMHIMFIHQR